MGTTRLHGLLWILVLGVAAAGAPAQEVAARPSAENARPSAENARPSAENARPSAENARPVRVRMVGQIGGAREVTLTPSGAYRIVDLGTREVLAESTAGAVLQVGVESGETCAVREGGKGEAVRAAGLRFESAAPDGLWRIRHGKREIVLPGALELSAGGRGLAAVNEAPLEQYLLGVVAGEGPASFHLEALKALAVAARSYTERNRGRHGECGGAPPGCDLCDTTHCHVYIGVGRVATRVREAVTATAGIVALHNGKPIDAVYSTDCGGRTQNNEDAWSRPHPIPYLRSVIDAPSDGAPEYCGVNPRHTWQVSLPLETLRQRLGVGPDTRVLWDFTIAATNLSGRVRRVRVSTTDDREGETRERGNEGTRERGSVHSFAPSLRLSVSRRDQGDGSDEPLPCEIGESGDTPAAPATATTTVRQLSLGEFRKLLSPRALPGSLFSLSWNDAELSVLGRGLGHAVGLCQYGAQGMALQGRSHEEILKHYYTGIELGRLDASVSPTAGTSVARNRP